MKGNISLVNEFHFCQLFCTGCDGWVEEDHWGQWGIALLLWDWLIVNNMTEMGPTIFAICSDHHNICDYWWQYLCLYLWSAQIMAEDDELWPQPDRVGRQVIQGKVKAFALKTLLLIREVFQHCLALKIFLSGVGDCHWGRAHLVHHQQDWQPGDDTTIISYWKLWVLFAFFLT